MRMKMLWQNLQQHKPFWEEMWAKELITLKGLECYLISKSDICLLSLHSEHLASLIKIRQHGHPWKPSVWKHLPAKSCMFGVAAPTDHLKGNGQTSADKKDIGNVCVHVAKKNKKTP